VQNPPPRPSDDSDDAYAQEAKDRRECFHSTAYTSLLLGAAFARAYNLPFLDGTPFSTEVQFRHGGAPWFQLDDVGRAGLKHLIHEYPAYDLMGTLTCQDQLFGPILDWFVRSSLQEHKGRASGPLSELASYLAFHKQPTKLFGISPRSNIWPWDKSLPSKYSGGSQEEGEAIFAAVMRAIDMIDFLLYSFKTYPPGYADAENKKLTKKVKVVRFGNFEAENIYVGPGNLRGGWRPSAASLLLISDVSPVRDIWGLWGWLRGTVMSDPSHYFPPNYIDWDSHVRHTTILPLRLFSFLLKRDFNIQVMPKTTGPITRLTYTWAYIPGN
jgi:hypothetical protein